MEGLPLVGLVDAHVRVVDAQADVAHMAQQVTLRVLRPRGPQVGAQAVEGHGAEPPAPALHRLVYHQSQLVIATHSPILLAYPNARIYQTTARQNFHTDSCDIVGLLCLQNARSGGLSALVSSVTIYNRLRAQRSDLARVLFQPLATDRRGEVPPGAKPYFEIPVFNWHQGAFAAIYQRQYVNSAQRFADAPRLTPPQVEALDALDALAEDPTLHLMMSLEPGDLQFVHNHGLLHDRTAFDDWPEPARRRYLLRLWLAPEDAQPLPPVYAQRYGNVVPGRRGGVSLPGIAGVMPLPDD